MLDDCLASVREKTEGVVYEIIIVDNASTSGSLSLIEKKHPDVKICYSDKNLGFGRANNLGAKTATGKYLFLLNPDTLLVNNAVAIFYNFMEAHPEAGICGGNMYKRDMTPTSSYYDVDFLTLEYKIIFNRKRHVGFNHTDNPKEVNVIVGADLFIRRSLFEDIGGFDVDFFLYFEEVELCDRARKLGHKVVSVPNAKVIHLQGGSAENKSEELNKWSYQEHWYSKFVYFDKTKGRFQTSLVYLSSLLKLRLAVVAYSIKNNSEKVNYWKTKSEIMKKTYNRYTAFRKRE